MVVDVQFGKLVTQVTTLLAKKAVVFVAISGFGGSGKSTLAEKLACEFDVADEQIIRLDHLYSKHFDGPGILDQVDWELLVQILKKAHAGERLTYVGKGYRGEALPTDEVLPKVVIVEGIRLLQPDLLPYFDISVWLDCPQEVAIERAKARDRAQGEDEETVSLWDTDWGPKDRLYFETYQPNKFATFRYIL